ncbi:hypothetical protein Y1Q_0003102 [Alligator mississippiensis]|uniref:Core shell protein Gag P30 domain-containing protein n=1 Tax=Alligator mississippiensis TaxID=8496 RepID=A0A151MDH3_ALLMI|nr:hypothetical protein Y1Q_0003102 [Alligator mississippiensis]
MDAWYLWDDEAEKRKLRSQVASHKANTEKLTEQLSQMKASVPTPSASAPPSFSPFYPQIPRRPEPPSDLLDSWVPPLSPPPPPPGPNQGAAAETPETPLALPLAVTPENPIILPDPTDPNGVVVIHLTPEQNDTYHIDRVEPGDTGDDLVMVYSPRANPEAIRTVGLSPAHITQRRRQGLVPFRQLPRNPVRQLPLREYPNPTGGQPLQVHVPWTPGDLLNWQDTFPKMREDPLGFKRKLQTVCSIYKPTWGDINQLLDTILNPDQRQQLTSAATWPRQEPPDDATLQDAITNLLGAVNTICPFKPDWGKAPEFQPTDSWECQWTRDTKVKIQRIKGFIGIVNRMNCAVKLRMEGRKRERVVCLHKRDLFKSDVMTLSTGQFSHFSMEYSTSYVPSPSPSSMRGTTSPPPELANWVRKEESVPPGRTLHLSRT